MKTQTQIPDAWYDRTVVDLLPPEHEDQDETTTVVVLRSWLPLAYAQTLPGIEVEA